MIGCTLELVTYPETVNSVGDTIKGQPVYRKVYAWEKGVRQSEFYQAAAVGLRPELTFEIRANSYKKEKELRFENETYSIIRTHKKNKEFIEIICQGVVNNG